MKQEDLNLISEYVEKGISASKRVDSNFWDAVMKRLDKRDEMIKSHIEETIKVVVNGKIDMITTKLNSYIKEDTEWKEMAKPAIELGTNVKGFGRVFAYILGILAAIGASWQGIQWMANLISRK
jgi:hypothetical protein